MRKVLSFDDVLITPKFSEVRSRADVNSKVDFLGLNIIPIISSNMDSVTTTPMALGMHMVGAIGCLHRFWSIEANVQSFNIVRQSGAYTMVSVGVGKKELERAKSLVEAGAKHIVLDIAHGASIQAVEQVKKLRALYKDSIYIIAGNFATAESIQHFKSKLEDDKVDAFKVGIGSGSSCITRVVTGCGYPALASLLDIKDHNDDIYSLPVIHVSHLINEPIILDGGIKTSGDYAKALAAGATAIMCGQLLAGADESPAKENTKLEIYKHESKIGMPLTEKHILSKQYRGSASEESYEAQGKISSHRTPEGESFTVALSGPVRNTIERLDAGLRSAMSYVGTNTIKEFQEQAELVEITNAGQSESRAHGAK